MARNNLIIDCDACEAPAEACHDCVVSALLSEPPVGGWLPEEAAAMGVLADVGLVPRLRLAKGRAASHGHPARRSGAA